MAPVSSRISAQMRDTHNHCEYSKTKIGKPKSISTDVIGILFQINPNAYVSNDFQSLA